MTAAERLQRAEAFFDDFVGAFSTFDGDVIAGRYATPYLAMHADGSSGLFVAPEDVGRYFQRVVDSYHQQGCRSCRYKDLEVAPLGRRCIMATVTWELLADDGRVLSAWRESYDLTIADEGLRIFASIDH